MQFGAPGRVVMFLEAATTWRRSAPLPVPARPPRSACRIGPRPPRRAGPVVIASPISPPGGPTGSGPTKPIPTGGDAPDRRLAGSARRVPVRITKRVCGVLQTVSHAHGGTATAEQLMRSRYSAFVKGLTSYLVFSWHPRHCPPDLVLDRGQIWTEPARRGDDSRWGHGQPRNGRVRGWLRGGEPMPAICTRSVGSSVGTAGGSTSAGDHLLIEDTGVELGEDLSTLPSR